MDKTGQSTHLSTLPQCVEILDQISEELEESEFNNEVMLEHLNNLGSAENDGILLHHLRIIGNQLKNDKEEPNDIVLIILVKYYMIANSKHPFRRAIASVMEKVKNPSTRKKVVHFLGNGLVEIKSSVEKDISLESGRHIVDLFLACLENFILGLECLKNQLENILHFLDFFLSYLLSKISNTTVGIDSLHFDIAVTLKCCVAVIRKCIIVDAKTNNIITLLQNIVSKSKQLLASEHFSWECYCAAGMTWVIIWNVLYQNDNLVQKIRNVFCEMLHPNVNVINPIHSSFDKIGNNALSNTFASLSFCNGVMTMVDVEILVCVIEQSQEDDEEKCLMVDYILRFLYLAESKCDSISSQVVASKCFTQWTNTMLNASNRSLPNSLKQSLLEKDTLESESTVEKLFHYSLNKLEHPTDAIRHQANEMLANLLKIGANLGNGRFAECLVQDVLLQSWEKRSTFTALNCLLEHVQPNYIMKLKPEIFNVLLTAMKHQSLAQYASETYKMIATRSMMIAESEKLKMIFDPLLNVMCETDSHHSRLLIDYCFTKLLRAYGKRCAAFTMNAFHTKLSSYSGNRTKTLAAFLACFRTISLNGYVKDIKNNGEKQNMEFLQSFLGAALVHQDEEIRQLGFSLFCEAVKPSSLISVYTLKTLKHAIPYNICSQDPAFRQRLINCMKKFFVRLKGNILQVIKTQMRNIKDDDDTLSKYLGFIVWLGSFCISQLYSTAPYPKRITCISFLNLITDIYSDAEIFSSANLSQIFSINAVNLLLDLLSDSYEDIRQISFLLLTNVKLKEHVCRAITNERVSKLTSTAIIRACKCSKPEWCGDAAYHLRFCAVLNNNGESNATSNELLRICSNLLNVLDQAVCNAENNLFVAATDSPMYGVLHCIKCLFKEVKFKNMDTKDKEKWHGLACRIVSVCFRVTAAVLPVVGSVSPEGLLPDVTSTSDDYIDGGTDDGWNELPDALKSLVLGENNTEHLDERKTRAIAQTVLVCCWRSAKESALLLQEITSNNVPLDSSSDNSDGVLSWQQLQDIGDHLLKQLMGARHRGAFEIAYSAFKACCARLWSIEHAELNVIPEKWMHNILSDIEDPSRSKDLCATRRSAGLPFFMQAFLSGNKSAKGKKHLHHVVTKLLSLCNMPDSKCLTSKVHSLNVLRGLVKDSSLGEEILPYVSQCTQVSISGFSSSIWAVRNSSTLLFSALVTRIFGVKRDRNDDFCLKNRLSANEFFSRFVGLHSFLLIRLKEICENLDKGSHHAFIPTLHPILLILSRIYPSTMQPTSGISLKEFIPLLIRCRASPVYKSRTAAALALASMLTWDQRSNILDNCCINLEKDVDFAQGKASSDEGVFSSVQNRLHGGLLQINEILSSEIRYNQLSTANLTLMINQVTATMNRLVEFLCTRKNNCHLTRSTALQLILFMRKLKKTNLLEDSEEWNDLLVTVKKSSMLESMKSDDTLFSLPGFSFILQSVSEILVFLSSSSFSELHSLLEKVFAMVKSDVIECVIRILSENWKEEISLNFNKEDLTQLEKLMVDNLIMKIYNNKITTFVYELLGQMTTSYGAENLFRHSIELSESCNTSQSSLLRVLISFQSKCITRFIESDLIKTENFTQLVGKWIRILSSACQSYENADDVRLAVANSISENAEELLLDPQNKFGVKSVDVWMIIFTLLCDEESEIRKVASHVVHRISSGTVEENGYPSVDTLALQHAALTLILTHGRRHIDACRHALHILARSESKVVPASINQVPVGETANTNLMSKHQDHLPGLFDRSETNTYLDPVEVSRIATIGLSVLDEVIAGDHDVTSQSKLTRFHINNQRT